ncbi:MAG: ABC transporter permease [Syntrophaceae bacterium]
MNFLRVRELVRKEFIQLFRDKKNLRLLILSPLLQLIVFGYVVSTDVRNVTVALLDQSRTPESRRVADSFNTGIFHIVSSPATSDQMDDLLLRRKVNLAVKIGPDFARRVRKGETGKVQIIADGSMSNMASVRIAYSLQVMERLNRQFMAELYPQKIAFGQVDARIRTWYNPNLDSRNFYVPGIVAVLIMINSLLFTSMAIIKEREGGTMEQLIVTPMKPAELILGKTIPYAIISLVQMVFVAIFAIFWFELPMNGSPLLLLAATCLFLLSTLGIGLFISTISSTQQQAMMTTFFFILPFFMLSGFVFPIANMPEIVQWLTYLNPLRYMLVVIRDIFLKGVGLEVFWGQFAALTIMGVAVFAGAVKRFRKRLD